jgi:RNA polymerase sigma-70 factor (ECF subfamily)
LPARLFPKGQTTCTDASVKDDLESRARVTNLQGNRHATLRILAQAYGKALHQYCQYMLQNDSLVDDVYQTVLLQAYSDLPTFTGRSSFRTWLFAIARYRCMDTLKVTRNRSRYVVQQAEMPDAPAPQGTPEELLILHARHSWLHDALQQLSAEAREVLVLRYFKKLSYEEMARLNHERAATLRVRVSRALSQLRQLLQTSGLKE